MCPDLEAKGICERTRCPYPHKKKTASKDGLKYKKTLVQPQHTKEFVQSSNSDRCDSATTTERSRYFDDNKSTDDNIVENQAKLSRILHKIDNVKANLNLCTGTVKLDQRQLVVEPSGIVSDETVMSDGVATEMAIPPHRKRPKLGKLPSYIPLD